MVVIIIKKNKKIMIKSGVKLLNFQDIKILRFSNEKVLMNTQHVLYKILIEAENIKVATPKSPKGD